MTPTPVVDNYKDCEDALVLILQGLTTYFPQPWQVSDDDAVLVPDSKGSKGFATYLCIYRPGALPATRVSDKIDWMNWEVLLDIFVKYTTYKETWSQFKAFRAEIINAVKIHPTLNGMHGVRRSLISSGSQPQYMLAPNAQPFQAPDFVNQTLSCSIAQLVEYSGGEW